MASTDDGRRVGCAAVSHAAASHMENDEQSFYPVVPSDTVDTMRDEEEDAPFVPDVRDRNRRRPDDETTVDGDSIREEMDALEDEVPFVPMIAKRRDARLKGMADAEDDDVDGSGDD